MDGGGLNDFEFLQLDTFQKAKKKSMWLLVGVFVVIAIVCSIVLWAPTSTSTLSSQSAETTMKVRTGEKLQPLSQPFPASSFQIVERQSTSLFMQPSTTREAEQPQLSVNASRLPSVTSNKGSSNFKTVNKDTNSETTQRPQTTQKPSVVTQPVTSLKPATSLQTATTELVSPSRTALNALRNCLTGGDYETANEEHASYGAYYFIQSTWNDMASVSGRIDLVDVRPDKASAQDQDAIALELYYQGYARIGWPNCGPLLYE